MQWQQTSTPIAQGDKGAIGNVNNLVTDVDALFDFAPIFGVGKSLQIALVQLARIGTMTRPRQPMRLRHVEEQRRRLRK